MTVSQDLPLAARPIDRAAHRRTDGAWLEAAMAHQDVLVVLMREGLPFMETGRGSAGKSLIWLGPEAFDFVPHAPWLFLGEDTQGTPIFAIEMPDDWAVEGSPVEGLGDFEDMRAAAASLGDLEANLTSTARSLFEWHRTHGFCSRCGGESLPVEAGWKRVCPDCGAEHFPRTDPVAIMLATRGEYCLLGRSKGWPAGFLSALAGFVEPGETVEQAAARELEEEAGIKADPATAEFLFCQPWPFPSSLMMGLLLKADSEEISVEQDELESAYWISREEAAQMLAGEHPTYFCPPPMAVAHHILKAWVERGPGG